MKWAQRKSSWSDIFQQTNKYKQRTLGNLCFAASVDLRSLHFLTIKKKKRKKKKGHEFSRRFVFSDQRSWFCHWDNGQCCKDSGLWSSLAGLGLIWRDSQATLVGESRRISGFHGKLLLWQAIRFALEDLPPFIALILKKGTGMAPSMKPFSATRPRAGGSARPLRGPCIPARSRGEGCEKEKPRVSCQKAPFGAWGLS